MVWTTIVEFDFQNDLFTNKGLIMDFSKKNYPSFADTCADQLFRDFHRVAYRYTNYRVSHLLKLLFINFSPTKKGSLLFRQRNQEQIINCLWVK